MTIDRDLVTYRSFTMLGDLKILDPDFARRIAACTGLRNRLIHEYNDIDPRKVFDSLVAALADIPVYLQRIEAAAARPET